MQVTSAKSAGSSPGTTAKTTETMDSPMLKNRQSPQKLVPEEGKDAEAQKMSKLINLFRNFDVNCDGVVDRSEMAQLMWWLNPNFSEAELNAVFGQVDKDADGYVQYEEFVRWLYGDSDAFSRLNVTTKTPKSLCFSVHGMNGLVHEVRATVNDTVKDLRLRACVPLGVPVSHLSDVRLRLKHADSRPLSDSMNVTEIPKQELQASIENHGQLFSACGKCVCSWVAEVPEIKAQFNTDEDARQVLHDKQMGIVCAITGKSSIAVWDMEAEKRLWTKSVPSTFNALALRGSTVYGGTEDGFLLAFHAKTGKDLWKAGPRAGDHLDAIHVIHAGPEGSDRVYAAVGSGHIFAWDAKTGKQLWKALHARADHEVWHLVGASTVNATHAETLFSGGAGGSVVSWDTRSGKELWRFQQHQESQGVQDLFYRELYDTVCVAPRTWAGAAAAGPKLRSLDGRTGDTLWSAEADNVLFLQGRRQYLFSATGKTVQAWDTLNNNLAWEVDLFRDSSTSIQAFAYADDIEALCVGTSGGLHLVDSKNGSVRGQMSVRSGVNSLTYTPA